MTDALREIRERPSLVWLLTWLQDIGRHTEDHPVSWTITCSPQQARDALDALTAARRKDWTLVPREPTELMLSTAEDSIDRMDGPRETDVSTLGLDS